MLDYKRLLKKAGLTQPEAAAATGMSHRKLSDILNGKKQFKDYEEEKFLQVVQGNSANIAEPRTNYEAGNERSKDKEIIRNLSETLLIVAQNGEAPNNMLKAVTGQWLGLQDEYEELKKVKELIEETSIIYMKIETIQSRIISFFV